MYPIEESDEFSIEGGRLLYRGSQSSWEIAADRLVCVGEATLESPGPGEDWVLCLITSVQGNWVEGSLYARGRNDALQWLSQAVASSLEVKLANAPPFRSRVMWPQWLLEQPLFQYQVPWPRRAFSRGLRRLGFPPRSSVQTVHPAVMDSLWRNHRRAASRLA